MPEPHIIRDMPSPEQRQAMEQRLQDLMVANIGLEGLTEEEVFQLQGWFFHEEFTATMMLRRRASAARDHRRITGSSVPSREVISSYNIGPWVRHARDAHQWFNDLRARRHAPNEARPGGRRMLEDALREMNEEWCVLDVGDRPVVFHKKEHTIHRYRDWIASRANAYAIGRDGEPQSISVAWWKWPERDHCKGGRVFDPAMPSGPDMSKPTGDETRTFNTWRGLAIEPDPDGDCSELWAMTLEVLCQGNVDVHGYLMDWIAYGFQHLGRKTYTLPMIGGEQGLGKTTLGANVIGRIYGLDPKYGCARHVSRTEQMIGRFNGMLEDKLFVYADEAFYAGDQRNFDALKSLVTDDTINIERKGYETRTVRNRLRLMVGTNHDHLSRSSPDSRREFILNALKHEAWTPERFGKLHAQLRDQRGLEKFLHLMLTRGIEGFSPHAMPPRTQYFAEQVERTQQTRPEGWWHAVLDRGYVLRSDHGHEEQLHEWPDHVSSALLMASWEQYAAGQRLSRFEMLSPTTLGQFMSRKALGTRQAPAQASKMRGLLVGEGNETGSAGLRIDPTLQRFYRLPTLDQARAHWDAVQRREHAWSDMGEATADDGNVQAEEGADRGLSRATSDPDDDIPF